jgi:hypothetical protein
VSDSEQEKMNEEQVEDLDASQPESESDDVEGHLLDPFGKVSPTILGAGKISPISTNLNPGGLNFDKH